ncbi:NAD(P)/FAD-dependent oxidoreductase [Flavihumibacter sp. UBA7668]|uniref:NAD(P)/FAD-dependent oxidoreductase n=1 Tax=Flavihumibacter sp. UBA7668 TaxID=1946542 RepID=UPI0025BCE5FC|nr:FAD-binding oxidoreductase [Flavihumibacter sp. UBA7668]
MQNKVDLLIIGGGIWGSAIAYYYSSAFPKSNVLVVEQQELNNGATSRAAALLTKVRSNRSLIPLAKETARIIPELELRLDDSLDVKRVGLAQVATDEASVGGLNQLYSIAAEIGEPFMQWETETLHRMAPWLKLDAAVDIGYFPGEAYCDPYRLGSFFARAARLNGVEFNQYCRVNELILERNKIVGILTDQGEIKAKKIVVAAGVWSNVLLEKIGASIPYSPVRSQFWITEPIPDLREDAPIILLPAANAYLRPEGNCLLFGIREQESLAITPESLPVQMNDFVYSADKGFSELAEVIHMLEPFFPGIYDVGIKSYMAGFSGYSPDSMISVGGCAGIENLFVAGGDCGAGIALSGGVGKLMTSLLAGEDPGVDTAAFDPNRFGRFNPGSNSWLEQCAAARSRKKSG